jgi:hypothetical protein
MTKKLLTVALLQLPLHEAGLLNKSSSIAPTLGVKIVKDIILVTICCAT